MTKTNSLKKRVVALACATAIASGSAQAAFLEDFYNSAGAGANVTSADVYRTQSMGVVTGGGVVWRTPQKNFSPFYFSPPTLSAGCGGIDVFLGSFGLANRDQFVAFLRNVGQNSAGLAFKVALQAMAPELESKIQDISETIQKWNQHFGNSCQAAKALMDAGPGKWMSDKVQAAKLSLLASGSASDYSDADNQTSTNGETVINNAPTIVNDAGKTIDAAELNLLWSAFNAGSMGLSDSEKELMMSLVGTTIFKKTGSGTSATIQANALASKFTLRQLVGDPQTQSIDVNVYKCDESDKCLNPTSETVTEKSFSRLVYEKSKGLQAAILNRTAPNQDDLRLLTVTTSIPIYKIIQVSTMSSRAYFSDDLLEQYSMAVAQEIASHYIEEASHNVEKMLQVATKQDASATKTEALRAIQTQLLELRKEMRDERQQVSAQLTRNGALLQQIEHLERVLYGNLSAQLAANMRFGR